jgi:hypothetical protein
MTVLQDERAKFVAKHQHYRIQQLSGKIPQYRTHPKARNVLQAPRIINEVFLRRTDTGRAIAPIDENSDIMTVDYFQVLFNDIDGSVVATPEESKRNLGSSLRAHVSHYNLSIPRTLIKKNSSIPWTTYRRKPDVDFKQAQEAPVTLPIKTEWWETMNTSHYIRLTIAMTLLVVGILDLVLSILGIPSLFYWITDLVLIVGAFGLVGTATLIAAEDRR